MVIPASGNTWGEEQDEGGVTGNIIDVDTEGNTVVSKEAEGIPLPALPAPLDQNGATIAATEQHILQTLLILMKDYAGILISS